MPLVLPGTDARWTWDFGDATPRIATREPAHTYYRAGTFIVRAFAGTRELARTRVVVAPRPVEEALPLKTRLAAWVDPGDGGLEAVVDAVERLYGASRTGAWLEKTTLPQLALRWRAEAPGRSAPLGPDDAIGIFLLEGFEGVVAFSGVDDGERALNAVGAELTSRGGAASSHPAGGSQWVMPGGAVFGVLLDRGYLYVCVPSLPDTDAELAAIAWGPEHEPGAVFEAVRALPDVRARPAPAFDAPWPAAVQLLAWTGTLRWRGALRTGTASLDLEAFSPSPAPPPEAVAEPPALAHVGETLPAVIGAAGLAPRWFLARAGVEVPDALASVLATLEPSMVWTAEPDAEGGALHLEGETADLAALRRVASGLRVLGRDVRVVGEGNRVELVSGPPAADRSPAPLLPRVQARHAEGAFGSGHLSLEADGVALRRAAAAGRTLRLPVLEEVPWEQVDRLFVDVAAEPGGLILRARLELRAE